MADEATDIVWRGVEHDFKLRVTGAFFNKQHQVAVNVDIDNHFSALPGRKIKFGETSQVAIVREFAEEMGIHVRPVRLIAVTDNLFAFRGKQTNEINFTWLVEQADQTKLFAKDAWEQTVTWRDTNDLADFKPTALQPFIRELPTTPIHLMNQD